MRELQVYINDALIGKLSENEDIWSFQYAQSWLERSDCYALCSNIPITSATHIDGSSKRYIQ